MANNSSSKELVLSTIKRFVQEKLPFSLKSTLMLEDLPLIDKVYDECVELRRELNSMNIDLAITPDTTAIFLKPSADFEKMMKDFHASFINLMKKALKNQDVNFNWLNFSGNRRLCTAGNSYMSVNIDGKIYPCHSVLFLKDKEQYSIGNIAEHKIHDLPFDINVEPEKCKKCDAKICFRCNAHSLDHSEKKTYAEKWVDHGWSENYCRVSKEISKMAYAYTKILTGKYTV